MNSNYNLHDILKNLPISKERRVINPRDLALAEHYLNQASLLNSETKALLLEHRDLGFLADALGYLSRHHMLTLENFKDLAHHAYPRNLSLILRYLDDAHLLTQENRRRVLSRDNINELSDAIGYAHRVGLLLQEYLNDLLVSDNPSILALIYRYLKENGLLTPDNRARILRFSHLSQLEGALEGVHLSQMLNQNVLLQLLSPENAPLLTDEARELLWEHVPGYLLREHWTLILRSVQETNPLRALRGVINHIMGHQAVDYNPQQSTHTASVHRSVSESALKLLHYYSPLNLEVTLARMVDEFLAIDDKTLVHLAAKRAIIRLTEPGYTFTDRVSNVSTRQLLALAYHAIRDDGQRLGTYYDAKNQLVQGLYEIQRGYNLNAAGVDDNALQDLSICVAGTFNKIIEKLYGIHRLVELVYTTKEGAHTKFPKLVNQYAMEYLNSIASPKTRADYDIAQAIIKRITSEDSIDVIWPKIQERVKKAIWDEFHEAFSDNPQDPSFKELLECYTECDIPDITAIQKQLNTFRGFNPYPPKSPVVHPLMQRRDNSQQQSALKSSTPRATNNTFSPL